MMIKKENNSANLIETKVETDVLKAVLEKEGLLLEKKVEITPKTDTNIPNQTLGYDSLTPSQKKVVHIIMDDIDTHFIVNYGSGIQLKMAHFYHQVLSMTSANHSDKVEEALSFLISNMKEFQINPIMKQTLFDRIFKRAIIPIEKLIDKYSKTETIIDEMTISLAKYRIDLLKDITAFEGLTKDNETLYSQLSLYIIAGQKKIEELELHTKDSSSLVESLNRRIEDLVLTQNISSQLKSQIAMLENLNHKLVDKIELTTTSLIPLWKKNIALCLGINHSLSVSNAQRQALDRINQLYQGNLDLDFNELKRISQTIISTIEETLLMNEESKVLTKQLHSLLHHS